MAQPLSATAVLAALKAEGVRVVEVGDWSTHNRAGRGAWGPLNGSMVHHTVTRGTASTVALVRGGRSDLPGPLCHGMIAKDGTVHLVGWGRANHAGGGDPAVLAAVIAEDYGTRPPAPHKHEGSPGAVDGNARFYGWECENLGDGHDPWPTVQYDAIVRVQAALCRAHGWSAKSVIGHLEWSDWKPDPKGFPMTQLRTDVAERLTHPASWNPGTTEPTPPEEDDNMAITDADARKILEVFAKTDNVFKAPKDAPDYSENGFWAFMTHVGDQTTRIRRIDKTTAAMAATVQTLAGLVGTGVDTAAVVAAVQAAIADAVVQVDVDVTGAQS